MSIVRTDIIQIMLNNTSEYDFLWWEGMPNSIPSTEVDKIQANLAIALGIPQVYLKGGQTTELDHFAIKYNNLGVIHLATRGSSNKWERCVNLV